MLALAVLALAPQGAAHDALHPAGADAYFECPDVAAVLAAYPTSPMARMFADETARDALRTLLGDAELTGTALLDRSFPLVGCEGLSVELLRGLRAASASLKAASGEQERYALLVLDAADEATAERYAELMRGGDGLWIAREGTRVVAGSGTMTPARWSELRDGGGFNVKAEQVFSADSVPLDPARGPVVFRGYQKRNLFAAVDELLGVTHEPLPELWDFLVGDGTTHFSMALEGGRFVTQSWSPGKSAPLLDAEWLARSPVEAEILAEAHPGCLLVAASSFDRAGLRDALTSALETDLSGAALFDKLGSSLVLFVQPVRGVGLPKTFLVIDLATPEGALDDLLALAQQFSSEGGVAAEQRKYKDVPYVTLTLPDELASLGDAGSVRPVIAVFADKLVVANGSLAMKAEIRRRQGDEKEQLGPASYPWTRGEKSFAADASAVLFVDWAAQVDGLFSLARSFGGMLGEMAPGLPFDLTSLPDAALFTRYMPPTLHAVRPHGGGMLHRHEAGFAFETWGGLTALAGIVSEAMGESLGAPPERAVVAPAPAGGPEERTRAELTALRTALTIYKIDRGAFPDMLQRLVEPSANYPQGYLDGRTALEPDAWGRAFRYELEQGGAGYALWSLGADGIDQQGAGDDVRAL